MTNSRNKGASFEREIANIINESLGLKKPLKRILEQTREKHLPDPFSGNFRQGVPWAGKKNRSKYNIRLFFDI